MDTRRFVVDWQCGGPTAGGQEKRELRSSKAPDLEVQTLMPKVPPTKEDFLLTEVLSDAFEQLATHKPSHLQECLNEPSQRTGAKASRNRINPALTYSETKLSVPTQKRAMDRKLFLYVRETVYSLPPLTRSAYSPVLHG